MSRLRIPTRDGNVGKATASGRADTEQPFITKAVMGLCAGLHCKVL
jgi:hypothetical protein